MTTALNSQQNFRFRSLWRGLGRVVFILLFTLALLELVTRLMWWQERPVTMFGKQVMLLPLPLVTDAQVKILDDWSKNTQNYLQFDPVLGWSIRPGVTAEWEGTVYTSNSLGIRSLREYSLEPPAGIIRMAAFGPSFTHCDEVASNETWEAQLEQTRPDIEVMNWGVGGYGTDQAFLRYKTRGAAYQPHIVIIGFEEENVGRNINRFRSFYRPGTGLPLTKPVYTLGGEGLLLLENPFNNFEDFYQTLRHDPARFIDKVCPGDLYCDEGRYRAQPLDMLSSYRFLRALTFEIGADQKMLETNRQKIGGEVTVRLIRQFVEEVVRNQAVPMVVVFPEQGTMADYEQGVLPGYYTGLITLHDMGIQVIDLASAFAEAKRTQNRQHQDFYASEGGHFNALGNQVVAQTIFWHLCSQGVLKNCS